MKAKKICEAEALRRLSKALREMAEVMDERNGCNYVDSDPCHAWPRICPMLGASPTEPIYGWDFPDRKPRKVASLPEGTAVVTLGAKEGPEDSKASDGAISPVIGETNSDLKRHLNS
jgi:hypothetical protein